jgi:hypothetical protein
MILANLLQEKQEFLSVKGQALSRASIMVARKQERIQWMTNVLPQLLTLFITTPGAFYIRPQVCTLESHQQS